ncbi:MAG TPA: SUMF1/EgtB/PvdO family nonheme iron enzyme [Kofleriaceae bacterium]|jgi:formylglycine-generating enzyme required for sulfatase activity
MRTRGLFAVGLVGATAFASGRVVRVEAPRRVEVLVPAGTFVQGLDSNEVQAAVEQCKLNFFGTEPPQYQSLNGTFTDFCTDYGEELAATSQRQVTLDAYLIDRDEVTVTDYRACIAAGACELDALVAGDERYIQAAWPMVNVTWDEAGRYCSWRGARLPTEAEWERAARGDGNLEADAVQTNAWPWGEVEQANDFNHGQARAMSMRELDRGLSPIPIKFFGDPDPTDGANILARPGSYPWGESPYGTRDQAGNVAEWTADAYSRERGNAGYQNLPQLNPRRDGGASSLRVVRGGSWRQPTFIARSNLRDPFNIFYEPSKRYAHIGFRCARAVP